MAIYESVVWRKGDYLPEIPPACETRFDWFIMNEVTEVCGES